MSNSKPNDFADRLAYCIGVLKTVRTICDADARRLVADAAGCSPSSIAGYIGRHREPSLQRLQALASGLQTLLPELMISAGWLAFGEDVTPLVSNVVAPCRGDGLFAGLTDPEARAFRAVIAAVAGEKMKPDA